MKVWPYDYDEDFQFNELRGIEGDPDTKKILTRLRVADGTFRYVIRTDDEGNRTLTTVSESNDYECPECCPEDDGGGGGGGGAGSCSPCWTPNNSNGYTGFSGSFTTQCQRNPDAHLLNTCANCCSYTSTFDDPCWGGDYGYCIGCSACYSDINGYADASICGQTYGFNSPNLFYQTKLIVVGSEPVFEEGAGYCANMQAILDANAYGSCQWYSVPTVSIHMSVSWNDNNNDDYEHYVGCPPFVTCEDCTKQSPNQTCPPSGLCVELTGEQNCGGCNACFGTAYPGDGQWEATTNENGVGGGCWILSMWAREDCTASKCTEWWANKRLCSEQTNCQGGMPDDIEEMRPGVDCECNCSADSLGYELGYGSCSHCSSGCTARSEMYGAALIVNTDLEGACSPKPYNLKTKWGWEGGCGDNCGGDEMPCGYGTEEGCVDENGDPLPWASCGTPCFFGYSYEAYCKATSFSFI